jgi:hypothetical protein
MNHISVEDGEENVAGEAGIKRSCSGSLFGILEREGKVSVSIVRDASAESLMTETVKKV